LVSFICVGGGAAIAFVVLSATLVTLAPGIAPWLVNGACHVALVLPVYALHRRFSFHSSAPHRQALPRYVAVQALSVGLVALFSMLVYRLLLVEPVIAASLVTALTSGVSFILLKAWVFARRHPRAAVLPLAGL
jgi:putative flippase GtrA